MPSRKTQVISLDAETENILLEREKNKDNVSEYVRNAIKQYAAGPTDVELLEALSDARKRRVDHLVACIKGFLDAVDSDPRGVLTAAHINTLRKEVGMHD